MGTSYPTDEEKEPELVSDWEEIVALTEEVAQPNTSLVNTIVPTGVFVIMHAEEDMTLVVSVANSAQSIQRAQEHFNTDSMLSSQIFIPILPILVCLYASTYLPPPPMVREFSTGNSPGQPNHTSTPGNCLVPQFFNYPGQSNISNIPRLLCPNELDFYLPFGIY